MHQEYVKKGRANVIFLFVLPFLSRNHWSGPAPWVKTTGGWCESVFTVKISQN